MTADTERMQADWDERAEKDALHFIETTYDTSDLDYFFEVGEVKARETIDPVLEDWDDYPLENGTALDIGCGVGRMTRALADRFDHVIGIDVSEKMVRRAKSLNSGYKNIDFYSNDGRTYSPIDESIVDFVFSYEVFQHFPTKEVVKSNIAEISRVMVPDGRTNIHFRPYTHHGETYVELFGIVPFPSKFLPYIPDEIKTVYKYMDADIEYADLKSSDTWTGTPISPSEFWRLCDEENLEVRQFIPDQTHDIGEKFFCIADKRV